MKSIGRGWQYTVYDLGDGRVLKKNHSFLLACFKIFCDSFPYIKHPLWKIPGYAKRCRQEALESMRLLSATKIESWMLGNPRVLDEYSYEQDKTIPIRKYWQDFSFEEKKNVVDDFVEFNKFLVANLLIDRNFCIADNFSVNAEGKIILMDLGEICADAKKIQGYLKERPWSSYDVINALPKDLQSYFIKKMDDAFGGR